MSIDHRIADVLVTRSLLDCVHVRVLLGHQGAEGMPEYMRVSEVSRDARGTRILFE